MPSAWVAGEVRPLDTPVRHHPLINRALGREAYDLHGPCLAEAMNTADPLLQDGWIPGQVDVHHDRRVLEVEANAARVGREERAAARVFTELVDQVLAFGALDAAVKEYVAPLPSLEPAHEDLVHPEPLAEDDRLGIRALEDL